MNLTNAAPDSSEIRCSILQASASAVASSKIVTSTSAPRVRAGTSPSRIPASTTRSNPNAMPVAGTAGQGVRRHEKDPHEKVRDQPDQVAQHQRSGRGHAALGGHHPELERRLAGGPALHEDLREGEVSPLHEEGRQEHQRPRPPRVLLEEPGEGQAHDEDEGCEQAEEQTVQGEGQTPGGHPGEGQLDGDVVQ